MSTWLDHWDRRYIDRVRLLVEILPVLAQEPRFALKGGPAINLFEHDLPRLSVDIDLAWLPVHDYAEDFETTFATHFKGMTTEPIEAGALLESRERLVSRVAAWLDEPSCAFLRSVESEQPDFGLIGLAHAAELPGVLRKLHNLAQRTAGKRAADRQALEETLARVAGAR